MFIVVPEVPTCRSVRPDRDIIGRTCDDVNASKCSRGKIENMEVAEGSEATVHFHETEFVKELKLLTALQGSSGRLRRRISGRWKGGRTTSLLSSQPCKWSAADHSGAARLKVSQLFLQVAA